MFDHARYCDHQSYAFEQEASRLLRGELSVDFADDEFDGEAAEICRMIELSGMIGLECSVLQGD